MVYVAPLKGLVLTGGASERMGTDKAILELEGTTLLQRAFDLLRSRLDDVWVSVRAEQQQEHVRCGFPQIVDRLQNCGPAAGILAAHEQAPEAAWFVVACDMPLLDTATLEALLAARSANLDATALIGAPDAAPEPLCAIYEPATLAAFQAQAGSGTLSPSAWLRRARVRKVLPPDPQVVQGANTTAEFERIRDEMQARLRTPANPADRNRK